MQVEEYGYGWPTNSWQSHCSVYTLACSTVLHYMVMMNCCMRGCRKCLGLFVGSGGKMVGPVRRRLVVVGPCPFCGSCVGNDE